MLFVDDQPVEATNPRVLTLRESHGLANREHLTTIANVVFKLLGNDATVADGVTIMLNREISSNEPILALIYAEKSSKQRLEWLLAEVMIIRTGLIQ